MLRVCNCFPFFLYCSNPFADLYSLSYLWFSTLTFVTTTVVGLTASLLLGNFCPDYDLLINDWFELPIAHFRVPPSLCFKARLSAKPLIRKWVFILMQIKLIYTKKVLHLASFWKWEFWKLGNGLLTTPENTITYHNALCLSPQNFA